MNAYYKELAVLRETGSAGKCCIHKKMPGMYVCMYVWG